MLARGDFWNLRLGQLDYMIFCVEAVISPGERSGTYPICSEYYCSCTSGSADSVNFFYFPEVLNSILTIEFGRLFMKNSE